MSLEQLLKNLEQLGLDNDDAQSERSKKYLNITRDTGEFLAVLIKATDAKTVLEVGTSNGYSTLWLTSSLPDGGHVFTIENNSRKIDEASENFRKAELDSKITQLDGDVVDLLSKLSPNIDFIFLDADRSQYLAIAKQLFGLLKEGGLLVCDNAVSHKEELEEFNAWIADQSNLSTSLVPVGKGELLVYKDRSTRSLS
ncbi:O-methyltransferase [Neptuniibacter sp. QD34_54]|uniref:O-methyltransferase n=1 Tax=Neptuniibacter sp. QD34_54 TaxID=3398208 RepID=UPI0039F4CF80